MDGGESCRRKTTASIAAAIPGERSGWAIKPNTEGLRYHHTKNYGGSDYLDQRSKHYLRLLSHRAKIIYCVYNIKILSKQTNLIVNNIFNI